MNEIVTKKVTVPQYVEDWIEYCKTNGIALGYALYCSGQASDKKVYDWIVESLENQETFARAWIDGYEIEKDLLENNWKRLVLAGCLIVREWKLRRCENE